MAGRPAFNKIDHVSPLQAETWTAKILECDLEADTLKYEVIGSKTGFDGRGDHKRRFVSDSGRVVIEAKMWMVNWSLRYRKAKLPTDYQVTWDTKPLFVDAWRSPKESDPAREFTLTTVVAQGLENGPHTLTLLPERKGKALRPAGFRVYRPPLAVEEE